MTKTIEEQLKSLREETLASLKQLKAENQKELQDLRVAVLGKKGSLTEVPMSLIFFILMKVILPSLTFSITDRDRKSVV